MTPSIRCTPFLMLLAACTPRTSTTSGVNDDDAGVAGRADSGRVDGGVITDAGHVLDAGLIDAGAVRDAGPRRDASYSMSPYNRVFVTSTRHVPAEFDGIATADAICAQRAAEAGLPGTFIAYLGTSTARPRSRLTGSRGWIRVDGLPFVDTVEDIRVWREYYPPSLDEFGDRVTGDPGDLPLPDGDYIMTGAVPDLTPLGTCNDWRQPPLGAFGIVGFSTGGSGRWSFSSIGLCDVPTRLLCFEVGKTNELPPPSSEGRLAFVTAAFTLIQPTGGVEEIDGYCNSEASISGVAGTFRALVATPGASAASRLMPGAPWVRPDGVRVASLEQLVQTPRVRLDAPITQNAGGSYHVHYSDAGPDSLVIYHVATGASSVTEPGTLESTCQGWTSTTMTDMVTIGTNHFGNEMFFRNGLSRRCGHDLVHLYCFQD